MVRPAALLAVGLLLLSGCSGLVPGPTPDPSSGEQTLGSVGIRNHDDRAHDVSVLIERDGSIAHWETVRVPARVNNTLGSAVVASGTYVDEPGDYTIKATLSETTTGKSLDLGDATGAECVVVQVVIDADGSYHFATAPNAYECQE